MRREFHCLFNFFFVSSFILGQLVLLYFIFSLSLASKTGRFAWSIPPPTVKIVFLCTSCFISTANLFIIRDGLRVHPVYSHHINSPLSCSFPPFDLPGSSTSVSSPCLLFSLGISGSGTHFYVLICLLLFFYNSQSEKGFFFNIPLLHMFICNP